MLVTASQLERIPNDEQQLIAELCLDVIAKPFDIDALLMAVSAATAHLAKHAPIPATDPHTAADTKGA